MTTERVRHGACIPVKTTPPPRARHDLRAPRLSLLSRVSHTCSCETSWRCPATSIPSIPHPTFWMLSVERGAFSSVERKRFHQLSAGRFRQLSAPTVALAAPGHVRLLAHRAQHAVQPLPGNGRVTEAPWALQLTELLAKWRARRLNHNRCTHAQLLQDLVGLLAHAGGRHRRAVHPPRRPQAGCSLRLRPQQPQPLCPRRCVSIFLDKNRHHIGKSQSKRPPKRTQRPPHPASAPPPSAAHPPQVPQTVATPRTADRRRRRRRRRLQYSAPPRTVPAPALLGPAPPALARTPPAACPPQPGRRPPHAAWRFPSARAEH
jgi:hypothetical protein